LLLGFFAQSSTRKIHFLERIDSTSCIFIVVWLFGDVMNIWVRMPSHLMFIITSCVCARGPSILKKTMKTNCYDNTMTWYFICASLPCSSQPTRDRLLKDCLLPIKRQSFKRQSFERLPMITLLDAIPDSTLSSKQVVPHPSKHNLHEGHDLGPESTVWAETGSTSIRIGLDKPQNCIPEVWGPTPGPENRV